MSIYQVARRGLQAALRASCGKARPLAAQPHRRGGLPLRRDARYEQCLPAPAPLAGAPKHVFCCVRRAAANLSRRCRFVRNKISVLLRLLEAGRIRNPDMPEIPPATSPRMNLHQRNCTGKRYQNQARVFPGEDRRLNLARRFKSASA